MNNRNKSLIISLIVMFALIAIGTSYLMAGIIAIIVSLGFNGYANMGTYKDRVELLQTECDPDAFLDKTLALQKEGSLGKKMTDYLKIDEAVAHMTAGRFEEAKSILTAIDPATLPERYHVSLIHQMNLMYVLYELGDIESAEKVYTEILPMLSVQDAQVILTKEILLAERAYFLEDYEGAKVAIEGLLKRELKNRTKLSLIYRLAQMAEAEGDEALAKSYYEQVAAKGNQLYIAKQARLKLS